jgi:nicotinate-nucleotide pyrophosphorylase (carboxylating)
VLIKDNHIALAGGVTQAVQAARAGTDLQIEVECDTLVQVQEALDAGADMLLLDNMGPDMLREAIALVGGRIPLEASGGINLNTIRPIAETGVDYISVGRITQSAPAMDIGMDFEAVG